MNEDVWRIRLSKAAGMVLGLMLCVPLVDALAGIALAETELPAFGNVEGQIDASAIAGAGDANAMLERLEEVADIGEIALPEAFESEVGLPPNCRDVRVDCTGTIVGCVVDAPVAEALSSLELQMGKHGWREVPLGGVDGATFVKGGGACAWVLVTCTQVSDAANLVYRCVYR